MWRRRRQTRQRLRRPHNSIKKETKWGKEKRKRKRRMATTRLAGRFAEAKGQIPSKIGLKHRRHFTAADPDLAFAPPGVPDRPSPSIAENAGSSVLRLLLIVCRRSRDPDEKRIRKFSSFRYEIQKVGRFFFFFFTFHVAIVRYDFITLSLYLGI